MLSPMAPWHYMHDAGSLLICAPTVAVSLENRATVISIIASASAQKGCIVYVDGALMGLFNTLLCLELDFHGANITYTEVSKCINQVSWTGFSFLVL